MFHNNGDVTYLLTFCLESWCSLLTSPSPSTTQAAAPRSSMLSGTTQLLCCSSLTLPPHHWLSHIHPSVFLWWQRNFQPKSGNKSCRAPKPTPSLGFESSLCSAKGLGSNKNKMLFSHPHFYQSLKMKLLFIRHQELVTIPALFSPDNFQRLQKKSPLNQTAVNSHLIQISFLITSLNRKSLTFIHINQCFFF